jgi:phosphatidylinositol glycan class Q protein
VTFLLPTVLAFYITFAIAELSIMMILGSLEIATVLLNHFPIFVLLLRIKDPKRIPGGIQISSDRHYTRIHSVPISFSEIFDHFNNFLAKLKRIYLTKKTTMDIVKGKPVRAERAKLHKLLYSALPSRPCSTIELYEEFKSFAS